MFTYNITCSSCGLQQGVVLSEISLPDQIKVCDTCATAAALAAAVPVVVATPSVAPAPVAVAPVVVAPVAPPAEESTTSPAPVVSK